VLTMSIVLTIRSKLPENNISNMVIHHQKCFARVATSTGWSSWSTFTPCNSACQKKRERFCTSSNATRDCPGINAHGVEEEVVVCSVVDCEGRIFNNQITTVFPILSCLSSTILCFQQLL
jgi:hypothetical protein